MRRKTGYDLDPAPRNIKMRRKKFDERIICFPLYRYGIEADNIVSGVCRFDRILLGVCLDADADFHSISLSSFIGGCKIERCVIGNVTTSATLL